MSLSDRLMLSWLNRGNSLQPDSKILWDQRAERFDLPHPFGLEVYQIIDVTHILPLQCLCMGAVGDA